MDFSAYDFRELKTGIEQVRAFSQEPADRFNQELEQWLQLKAGDERFKKELSGFTFLMLDHAFETWKCVRVELKTDALNEESRRAIARLGAREEGILRRHLITDAGRFRDTVYFSIIDSEWQTVKADLMEKLRVFE